MRAKFFHQYRLFFRFRKSERIIVLSWVNDAEALRAYSSGTDAYAVFNKMLAGDNPPDNWAAPKVACEAPAGRLAGTPARTRDLRCTRTNGTGNPAPAAESDDRTTGIRTRGTGPPVFPTAPARGERKSG